MKFFFFLCVLLPVYLKSAECISKPEYEIVLINGDSMSPALKPNQEIKIAKNAYHCKDPKIGDIVIFEIPSRKNRIIKKIYAIPGDTFEYKDSKIFINKKILKNSESKVFRINSKMLSLYAKSYPKLPSDSYLVLGEKINGSFDASQMGFIDRKQIVGKLVD